MGLLKDWADRWLHHRTAEAGNLPVSTDNENQRMSAVATDEGVLLFSDSVKGMKARTTYLQHRQTVSSTSVKKWKHLNCMK